MYASAPGTWQTHVVVWSLDDPTKAGDPRYWWSAEEAGRLGRPLAGTPKGHPLEKYRREFGGDEGVLVPAGAFQPGPPEDIRLSLTPWRNADPERTLLIVGHTRRFTEEEEAREARAAENRLPPEVEELRREWVEALQAGDESADELREQLEAELAQHGRFFRPAVAFRHERAVEVTPGVFVQDDRPGAP